MSLVTLVLAFAALQIGQGGAAVTHGHSGAGRNWLDAYAGEAIGLHAAAGSASRQEPMRVLWQLDSSQAALRQQSSSSGSSSGGGGRSYSNSRRLALRGLLSGFSTNVIQVAYSSTGAVCPSGAAADWAEITGFGNLVSDNWVCSNPARPAQVYGASAQDYQLAAKAGWETYGWAAFNVPAAPTGSAASKARLEGLSLEVIGNQGLGGSGKCTVEVVDIAIYTDSGGAPDTEQYSAKLLLPGDTSGSSTFNWTSNSTSVLSFDIVDLHPGNTLNPNKVELSFSATYWLRVKMLVPYGGDSGNAKCFVNWALNDVSKTSNDCLWQEAAGGAAGYSTACLGAASGTKPAASQTFFSCFNGGQAGATLYRRCWSYRNQVANPITCPAQFRDFNFAFYGYNAVNCSAAPTNPLPDGSWPPACAGKLVGQLCAASCTWGGSATVECLYTGAWNSTVIGACAAAPTNCSGTPSPDPAYGSWPASCDQTLIGQTCTAVCNNGGSVTADCQTGGTWSGTFTGTCSP